MTKVALTISAILIFVYLFVVGTSNYFGSYIDWASQHTVFPDYFRNLFYQTHHLFPDFAPQIGSGQNIYYFSYYGLYNPWLSLSYLFPFIPMVIYVQVVNVLIIVLDGVFFYFWTSTKFPKMTSYVATLLFLLSTPIILQSHRHFMFTAYMPFLLMSLIGIDLYFARKQRSLIVVATFLAIMTSYYFSPGVLLAEILYFVFNAMKTNSDKRSAFHETLRLIGLLSISVIMSMVLLLPTCYVLIHGRAIGEADNVRRLLIPTFRVSTLMYDSYSLGYGFVSIMALFLCLTGPKRELKMLGIAILVIISIPLFSYLLNGALYVRDKGFTPLSPLIGLMILEFLDAFLQHRVSVARMSLCALLAFVWAVVGGAPLSTTFVVELVLIAATMSLYYVTRKDLLALALIAVAMVHMVRVNQSDVYVNRDAYTRGSEIPYNIKDLSYRANLLGTGSLALNRVYYDTYKHTSVYSSLINNNYATFYRSIFNNAPFRVAMICPETNNVLLQSFLGVKYVITGSPSSLYTKAEGLLYTNRMALPIGYASSELLSRDRFAQLDQFEQLEALLSGIVVNEKTDGIFHSALRPYDFKLTGIGKESTVGGKRLYVIDVQKQTTFQVPSREFKDKILLLRFDVTNEQSCSEGDLSIAFDDSINMKACKEWMYKSGNRTFRYVLSTGKSAINVTVAKGHYVIENVEARLLDSQDMAPMKYDPFVISDYQGNCLRGSIDVSRDGYFALSIPYDTGFTFKVDGHKTEYVRVNNWFIGFKIRQGKHEINFEFDAPLKKAGIGLSTLGFLMCLLVVIADKRSGLPLRS